MRAGVFLFGANFIAIITGLFPTVFSGSRLNPFQNSPCVRGEFFYWPGGGGMKLADEAGECICRRAAGLIINRYMRGAAAGQEAWCRDGQTA